MMTNINVLMNVYSNVLIEKGQPDLYDPANYCSWAQEKYTWKTYHKYKDDVEECQKCLAKNDWKRYLKSSFTNATPMKGE